MIEPVFYSNLMSKKVKESTHSSLIVFIVEATIKGKHYTSFKL